MKFAFIVLTAALAIASNSASAAMFCQPLKGDKSQIVVHEQFGDRLIPHINTHGIFKSMDECKNYLDRLSFAIPSQNTATEEAPTVGS